MTFILFSKGGYEDEYFKKYPEIIKQRSSTDSVLRTLYTAHFDSRGQLDRFIEGITKDWVVRIWHPLYDIDGGELENSKIKCSEYELALWELAYQENTPVLEIRDNYVKVDPDALRDRMDSCRLLE